MDIKRYKSRYSIVDDKKKLRYATAAAVRLSLPDLMEVFEDYLTISRKRQRNPLALSKLQLNLLQDIIGNEYVLKKYRKRLRELNEQSMSNDISEEENKTAIEEVEREVYFHEVATQVYREIADGIAWRSLNYNRALLHHLTTQPTPGPISLEGIESELIEWARTFDSGEGIAILNDITTFLRIGDITIIKDDGTCEFVEVKTKRPRGGARISRQKERLQQTIEFFSTGETPYRDGTLVIDEFDIEQDNYLNNIDNLIKRSVIDGAAITQIGEHLLVYCIDFRSGNEEIFNAIVNPTLERYLDRSSGDILLHLISLDKFRYARTYAPYSIFPFSEDICIALMSGALTLCAVLNVTQVMTYFNNRGWRISKGPQEHVEEATSLEEVSAMTVNKGPFSMIVPPMLIGMLGFEFLKPGVLIKLFEEYYKQGPSQARYSIVNFTSERDIWR